MPALDQHPVYRAAHARGYVFESEVLQGLGVDTDTLRRFEEASFLSPRVVSRTGTDLEDEEVTRSNAFRIYHIRDLAVLLGNREDLRRKFPEVQDVPKSDGPLIRGALEKITDKDKVDYKGLVDYLPTVMPNEFGEEASETNAEPEPEPEEPEPEPEEPNYAPALTEMQQSTAARFRDYLDSKGWGVMDFFREEWPHAGHKSDLYRILRGVKVSPKFVWTLGTCLAYLEDLQSEETLETPTEAARSCEEPIVVSGPEPTIEEPPPSLVGGEVGGEVVGVLRRPSEAQETSEDPPQVIVEDDLSPNIKLIPRDETSLPPMDETPPILVEVTSEGFKIKVDGGYLWLGTEKRPVARVDEALLTEGSKLRVGKKDGRYTLFLSNT